MSAPLPLVRHPLFRFCLYVLSTVLLLPVLPGVAAERPNILWITSEDNAAHWLGCYGNTEASTPRIDAFAAGGVKFTRAYSNAPFAPSPAPPSSAVFTQ